MPEDQNNENQNDADQINPDQNHENKHDWLRQLLKGFVIMIAILLLLIVVGFGLLVGFCALGR